MAKDLPPPKKPSGFPSEAKGLILLGFSLILILTLLSFHADESGKNWLGLAGWGLAYGFSFLFGLCSFLIPLFLGWLGWQYLLNREIPGLTAKALYFTLFLVSACLLLNLCAEIAPSFASLFETRVYTESTLFDLPYPHRATRCNLGGVPLYYLYRDLPTINLQRMLSDVGIALTFSIAAAVSFLLLTQIRLIPLLASVKQKLLASQALLKKPK